MAARDETEPACAAHRADTVVRLGIKRWRIAFVVIALLVCGFSLLAFLGLTHSDWLYGTYDGISAIQWQRIADLRDALVDLGGADEAVTALDDALLVPRPSTEDVLFDLRQAAQTLDGLNANDAARQIQRGLYALIGEIGSDKGWTPTPRPTSTPSPTSSPTPFVEEPVARTDGAGALGLRSGVPVTSC